MISFLSWSQMPQGWLFLGFSLNCFILASDDDCLAYCWTHSQASPVFVLYENIFSNNSLKFSPNSFLPQQFPAVWYLKAFCTSPATLDPRRINRTEWFFLSRLFGSTCTAAHIAGSFRGRKLSRISRFCGYLQICIFSIKFWGCGIFWQHQQPIRKVLFTTIYYCHLWASPCEMN